MRPGNLDEALIALNPDALIATDERGHVLRWNEGATRIFGFTAEDALGRSLADLTVPPDRAEEHRRLLEAVHSAGYVRGETVRMRKDGSLIHIDVLARQVEHLAARAIIWSKRDVTQPKLLREAKKLEARFQDLLESTPDGMLMLDETGYVLVANGNAEHLFGYHRGELHGESVEMLLPERFRRNHVIHRMGYLRQPRVRSMGAGLQLFGLRKNGSEFPVEISLSPLRTGDGPLVAAAIRDITERKRVEQKLQEQNLELARANQAKSQFLASMSHELRTPLNAIIGFTGTLLMELPGPLNAEQQKQLTTVQQAGRHLLALINDLLNLSRIEAGARNLTLVASNCHELAAQAVDEVRPLAAGKGLDLVLDSANKELEIATDKRLVHQILLNLLGNAIKYTNTGSVCLRLDGIDTRDGPVVRFHVIDTGIGISATDRDRLFKAFSQVGQASATQEGVGLGLFLSTRLAEMLGGEITLESTPGAGSVFTLLLPASAQIQAV